MFAPLPRLALMVYPTFPIVATISCTSLLLPAQPYPVMVHPQHLKLKVHIFSLLLAASGPQTRYKYRRLITSHVLLSLSFLTLRICRLHSFLPTMFPYHRCCHVSRLLPQLEKSGSPIRIQLSAVRDYFYQVYLLLLSF